MWHYFRWQKCWVVFFAVFLLGIFLPWIGLAAALVSGDIVFDLPRILDRVFTPRVLNVFLFTCRYSLLTSILSTVFAFCLVKLLNRLALKERRIWLGVFLISFLNTPYLMVHGWVLILNSSKYLYSEAGLVLMSVFYMMPLACLLMYLAGRLYPKKYLELAMMHQWSFGDKWLHLDMKQYGVGIIGSLIMVFCLTFGNYEIASILQQLTYPLEIYAAFGSFFDYGTALVLGFPSLVILLPVLFLGSYLFRTRIYVSEGEKSYEKGNTYQKITIRAFLFIFPLLAVFIPLGKLILFAQMSAGNFSDLPYLGKELVNTVKYGVLSSTILTIVGLSLFSFFKMRYPQKTLIRFFVLAAVLLAVPAILSGIGYVYLFNDVLSVIADYGLQLYLVETVQAFPYALILFTVLFFGISNRWWELQQMHQIPGALFLLKILIPSIRKELMWVWLLLFFISIKELPASLLTYPPGGGTLSLTIETLLHFGNPTSVAIVCLAQMGCCLLVVLPLGIFYLLKFKDRHL